MQKTIVDRFTPFVIHIARRYRGYGVPLDDLVQEGLIGLLEADRRFDGQKAKFSTYAAFWIKNRIISSLNNESKESLNARELNDGIEMPGNGEIRPPSESLNLPDGFPGKEALVLRFSLEEGKTLDEIARLLDTPRERVRQIKRKAIRRLKSLNTKLTEA